MVHSKALSHGLILFSLVLIAACSNNNNNNNNDPVMPPANQAPVANAGADSSVDEGSAVTLDGSASADPDGSITAYDWTQTSGTAVTLAGADTDIATFTAPMVVAAETLVFRLTVTDNEGATGTDSVAVSVSPVAPPNQPPIADAGPDLAVNEGSLVTLDGSASTDPDDGIGAYQWTQTGGPIVVLAGADTDTATFTAPVGGAAEPLVFELTVTDNSGAAATDSATVTVNQFPIADAGPDQSVVELTNVMLDGGGSSDPDGLVATFAWTQTEGPAVTIENADTATPGFTAPAAAVPTDLVFQLIVTDDAGVDSQPDLVTITVNPTPTEVTVSGRITYDFVPHDSITSGLDYSAIEARPVRGALVQALNAADGNPIAGSETTTDTDGNYTMQVPAQASIRIRANARLLKSDAAPVWDFQVVDNGGVIDENPKPLYALDGDAFDSGIQDWVVDLHADSGWDGAAYSGIRAAAPFAILDAVYDSVALVLASGPDLEFPQLLLNWSPFNTTDADASIGVSFYDPNDPSVTPSGTQIFILGEEDVDTDEYDRDILAHEWAHYFEDRVARTDSIAGGHSPADLLDLRVAFSEGWGNSFAAMATGDPAYRDAVGIGQAESGVSLNLEDGSGQCANGPNGWYAECTIGQILYDLYDDVDDGADQITMGFGPIYDVLTGAQTTTPALNSIYTFAEYLRVENPAAVGGINALLVDGQISADSDIYGDLETNDGAADGVTQTDDVLPLYTTIQTNGTPVTDLCSNADAGDFNKVSNHRYLKFTVDAVAVYVIRVDATDIRPDGSNVDPDFALYDSSGLSSLSIQSPAEFEEKPILLGPGDYTLVIWDDNNVGVLLQPGNKTFGRYCQNVTISVQ